MTLNYIPASMTFVIKHSLIFIFFTFTIYLIISRITRELLSRELLDQQITRLLILRSLTFIVMLSLVLVFQLNYINKKEGFVDYNCQYYDEFDNIVYANQLAGLCPKLDVIQQSKDIFEFTTDISLEYQQEPYGLISMGLVSTRDYGTGGTARIKTHTLITYTDNFNIETYDSKLVVISTYDIDGETMHDYRSLHRNLININESNYFEQVEKKAEITLLKQDEIDFDYYTFADSSYVSEKIYTTKIVYHQSGTRHFDLMKKTTENGYSKTVVVGSFMLNQNDIGQEFSVFMVEFNEEEYLIYEFSHSTDHVAEYVRTESRIGNNHGYSIDYSRRLDEDYLYYSYISGPTYDNSDTIWNFSTRNILEGTTIYTTGVHYYEVQEKTYGKKVIRKTEKNYDFFRSVEDYEKVHNFSNPMYSRLYDYSYQVTRLNMNDPYYIIKDYFPFAFY
ncbi:hypothetical protein KQ51_01259 [Candidatus Izimaplasma bacterium HR1]|nr:hypothetical protein KQ51_01259 [Candidatus Izimaplasma bacterium HR1]